MLSCGQDEGVKPEEGTEVEMFGKWSKKLTHLGDGLVQVFSLKPSVGYRIRASKDMAMVTVSRKFMNVSLFEASQLIEAGEFEAKKENILKGFQGPEMQIDALAQYFAPKDAAEIYAQAIGFNCFASDQRISDEWMELPSCDGGVFFAKTVTFVGDKGTGVVIISSKEVGFFRHAKSPWFPPNLSDRIGVHLKWDIAKVKVEELVGAKDAEAIIEKLKDRKPFMRVITRAETPVEATEDCW